jgi:large repetitive protein
MGIEITLPPELEYIGQAIGLFDVNGDLDGTWFNDPVGKLEDVLTEGAQRGALIELLDMVLPPEPIADPSLLGIADGEKWHPLLQTQPNGNFYLTVNDDQNAHIATFGVGARYATAGSTSPAVSVSVRLPLIQIAGTDSTNPSVSFIAGEADGPLSLTLAVALGWQMPAQAITLDGISLSLRLAPFPSSAATASIAVTLQGLDIDGSGAQDVTLDPDNLGSETIQIIVGLVCQQLRQSSGNVAVDLLALLGLNGTPPEFPFATIASDPHALTSWARALVAPAGSSPAPMNAWLGHLASLFGVTATVTATPSAGGMQWSVPFFALNATSTVALSVVQSTAADGVTPLLTIGIGLALVPPGAMVRFDTSVALIAVPLAGQSAATAFPSASLIVTAPGDPLQQPWLTSTNISVKSLRAGVLWNGSALMPLLELDDVAFQNQSYPVVDLTNANSVIAAAGSQLVGNIVAALGNSPIGLNLALLAGLIRPASAPTAPLVDFAQLAAHPTSAIATLHRNALLSTTYPWSNYFGELAALLLISGAVSGSGTFADPWVAAIVTFGPMTLQLAAWNAQTSGNAADPQLLRIGVRAFVSDPASDPSSSAWWMSELLAVDMPASGANTITLLGAHHAALTFVPGDVQEICDVSLTADSVAATFDIVVGSPPLVTATVVNLVFATDSGALTLPSLAFPFPNGFDVQNPLPSLGISVADLENLVRGLLTRALSDMLGSEGLALATLLGAASGAPGLQDDFPLLVDPGGPGSLFSDPLAALQAWISALAAGLSSDGTDFASSLVAWLSGFLAMSLPDDLFSGPDLSALDGSGTYDDPWLLPLGDETSQASGLLWLEPNGPPSGAVAATAFLGAVDELPALADAMASVHRYFPAPADGLSADTLADGLQSLSDHLTATDGVVPLASQLPGTANWLSGTAITAPHHLQPGDPSACSQILSQIDSWTGQGGQRAVLLLGPAFSDHTAWVSLLAQIETAHPGTTNTSANFDLRVPDVDPASIDLRGITAVADFYTADLQSDGSGNTVSLVAQIGLVVAQISILRPGAKLMIVAHSTAGIAARLYVAANASQIQGLITLGTPHTGAPLTPLTDPPTAEALRWITHMFPGEVAAGPLRDAIQHLLSALDGYLPVAPNALPEPWPYPIGDFTGSASTDTGGVPALALGGLLGGGVDLLGELKAAAVAAVNGFVASAPTHLAWGVRSDLEFGADADVAVDAAIRLDVGRLALRTGVPEPAHAAHALHIDTSLWRPDGWLVGGTLAFAGLSLPPIDVRVRSADLGLTVTLVNGVLTATPRADLHEASFHDITSDLVGWGEAQLEALLGSVFQTITATVPAANTSLGGLLWALEAFGIAAPDPHGGIGIATGALNALAVDPLGYLAPKVAAALADPNSTLGFTSPAPNQFVRAIANLPIEAFVQTSPAAIGLRTIPSSAGLALADGIDLAFSASLPLATMAPDVSASLTVGPATFDWANATLTLELPPAIPSLQLYPATATAAASFANAVEALVVSAAVSALTESVLDSGYTPSGLYTFFNDPGAWLVRSDSLGNGTVLDPAKINALLQIIGQAIGTPAGQGLTFAGGVTLVASGQSPTTLSLSTAPNSPIGPLSFSLGVIIDATRHLSPNATITLEGTLSGGSWPSIAITLGVDPSGISLIVTPGGGQPILLLPSFGGAATLMGAATMLLPAVLDELVAAVTPNSGPQPALLTAAIGIATALNIYDPTNKFDHHDSAFAALLSGNWPSGGESNLIAAIVSAFSDSTSPLRLPSGITVVRPANTDTIGWSFSLSGTASGTVVLTAGWDANNAPIVKLEAENIQISNAPFAASITCGYESGLELDVTVDIKLDSLGLAVVPEFVFGLNAGQTTLTFLPFGANTDAILAVKLLPALQVSPALTGAAMDAAAEELLRTWGIPLVADVLISATQAKWSTALWAGGKSIGQVLQDAGIVQNINGLANVTADNKLNPTLLAAPFSTTVVQVLSGLLDAVASTATIQLTDDLQLGLVSESGKLGIRLLGTFALSRDSSPQISLLFGKPATWLGSEAGVTLFLFSGSPFTFAPELNVRGLGLGVAGDGDTPLVNDPKFRVGAIDGYIAFDVDFSNPGSNLNFGGGLEIDQLGLPFDQLQGANSSNPVASSLLGSDAGSGNGDAQAVNPGVDVIAYYLDGSFTLLFGGTDQPIVIPIHRNLGPVYIDQIDVALDKSGASWAVVVGIDGSVMLSSLAIGIDELAVSVPLDSIMTPSGWSLDLQGLAVGFTSATVEIAGGLRKFQRATIEYDGMLSVTAGDIGLTIVGAYSRPTENGDTYTSLFVFGAADIPLGGPPFMFITGLGAGGGYNRELIAPTDMNNIDSFILVSAIDDGSLANDPMGALMQVSTSFPPRRGAFWLAAGVRFTTFQLVNSTVVVTVAIDKGFEIDVLGISRMALPTENTALVSVELALKARYNSEENILSVQAQLTDNSYLFDRHCQLTGGFAFFMWFSQGQFVLTLGGYNPSFSKPPQFPDVPRLGYNWSLSGDIVIKGGAYFALTNSCVMAGGSLSVTASFGPVSAWFDAYVDFLVAWDPFAYSFDVGIEIGARFQIKICLFHHCVTIGKSVSIGASLAISGPPFYGTATIDLAVATITVSFGGSSTTPVYITDWNVFTQKYLSVGTPGDAVVSIQFQSGLLPPDPPGAQLQPGSAAGPWKLGAEFSFTTTTRMPASTTTDFVNSGQAVSVTGVNALDIAPMDKTNVGSTHTLQLDMFVNGAWVAATVSSDRFTITAKTGFFPEAMWHWVDPHHLPAAARTITAVAGFDVDAHVVLVNQSAVIPISTLVDDLSAFALALPFVAMAQTIPVYQSAGAWADTVAGLAATASSAAVLAASANVLSGQNSVFARNRQVFGLPAQGLAPLAVAALTSRRSAPPLLTPLTTGLTMKPVGLALPQIAQPVAIVNAVLLDRPRLRALTQTVAPVAADAPAATSTSVGKSATVALSGIPRMRPPVPADIVGAQLITVPAASAPRSTKATLSTRALRNADFGAAIGVAHQQAFAKAASDLTAGGVVLGAGAAHIWDVPGDGGLFTIAGSAGVRMLCTDRAGAMLQDLEFAAAGSPVQQLPPGTALVAIECLGALPAGTPSLALAPGAVTTAYAPAGKAPAVGWQNTSMLVQIGPARFASRGATLRLARRTSARRSGQTASYGMVLAADALRGQIAVETCLPASVDVVIVMLDGLDSAASQQGDLALAVQGATLAGQPQRVVRGNRRCLCYDVSARDANVVSFTVSVANSSAWSVCGVVGVRGTALEWAASLQTATLDGLIPEGAIAPGGSLTVKYDSGAAKP